jgi:hypothetical protein
MFGGRRAPFAAATPKHRRDSLPNRQEFLVLWSSLPRVESVSFNEAMALLENRMLWGRGLGWIDIHLLASTLVSGNILWTRNRLLWRVAL